MPSKLGLIGRISKSEDPPPGCRWIEIYIENENIDENDNIENKSVKSEKSEKRNKFYLFLKSFLNWKILDEEIRLGDQNFRIIKVLVPLCALQVASEELRKRSFISTCVQYYHHIYFSLSFFIFKFCVIFCFEIDFSLKGNQFQNFES